MATRASAMAMNDSMMELVIVDSNASSFSTMTNMLWELESEGNIQNK